MHLLLDFVDVVELVGERGVDVGESNCRDVGDDLVGCHAPVLMPYNDIEHADTVAGDACFPPHTSGVLLIRSRLEVDTIQVWT